MEKKLPSLKMLYEDTQPVEPLTVGFAAPFGGGGPRRYLIVWDASGKKVIEDPLKTFASKELAQQPAEKLKQDLVGMGYEVTPDFKEDSPENKSSRGVWPRSPYGRA